MKKLVVSSAALLLCSPAVLAQSSGNFAAALRTEQCEINTATGALQSSAGGTLLSTTVKTPNDGKTTLLITPAFVTGLYTNTYIDANSPTSAKSAAIKVMVTLDGVPVPPATAASPDITYDQRFQRISTDMWTQIRECSENAECNFEMVQSTLAANSFNFVKTDVGGGTHVLDVSWRFECDNNGDGTPDSCSQTFLPNTTGACVGPGVVTVTQTKAFSQSGGISVQ